MSGRRPKPTAIRRAEGNRGKRAWNHDEPQPPDARPRCPGHLSPVAQKEWRRVSGALYEMGVLTVVDRTALAAYCQAYGRWVEAEEKLRDTPALYKTPSGYVQQSPWLTVANKQLELMGRYMTELGMTPAARTRVAVKDASDAALEPIEILLVDAFGDGEEVLEPPGSPDRKQQRCGPCGRALPGHRSTGRSGSDGARPDFRAVLNISRKMLRASGAAWPGCSSTWAC